MEWLLPVCVYLELRTDSVDYVKKNQPTSERIHNSFKIRQSGQAYSWEWLDNCLSPNVGTKCCLILDSFSLHQQNLFVIPDKHIQVTTISPGATSLVQPLDVYFFRQCKKFAKRFCELVLFDKIDIELHSRNAIIINLHAVIYNQFSAPYIQIRIKHAWKEAQFPVECEDFDAPDNVIWKCSTLNCKTASFIQCVYCRLHLCLTDFYTNSTNMLNKRYVQLNGKE